jgi:hypothetical protein
VPVHVQDGAGELRVAGELAAEGVRRAAIEHVAAVLVSVDRHVAQRGGAAQVQAPGQASHLFEIGLSAPIFSLKFFYNFIFLPFFSLLVGYSLYICVNIKEFNAGYAWIAITSPY